MLSAAWKPQLDQHLAPDQEAMQLYLMQQHCSRGVLSQFLDERQDWRWCMQGEEVCEVCQEPHDEARPLDLIFALPIMPSSSFYWAGGGLATGPCPGSGT